MIRAREHQAASPRQLGAYYPVNRSRTDQAQDAAVRASHRRTRFEIAHRPRALAAART